jgi:hypothetical protein
LLNSIIIDLLLENFWYFLHLLGISISEKFFQF